MRGAAIKKILEWAQIHQKFDLSKCSCLEAFARDGSWQTKYFVNGSRYAEAWEVDCSFAGSLRANLPNCDLVICDSITRSKKVSCDFDLIVADNPQAIFDDENQYCEHFDFLPNIGNLFKKDALIVFNINRKPYNLEKNQLWKKKRQDFYEIDNVDDISKEFFHNFYCNYFKANGLVMETSKIFDRNSEYLSYFVCKVAHGGGVLDD